MSAPDDLIQSVSHFFGFELGRTGDAQPELELRGGMHPGGQHVVGVAGPRDGLAPDRAAMLLERHHVRQHLAGMRAAREPVDHRHGGVARELHQRLVIERADHDRIDIARQHARGVGDGLAAAELHLGAGQRDGFAAELAHADVEGDAGAGRRPVEDHGERAPGERALVRALALALRLHGAARLDHPAQLGLRDVDRDRESGGRRSRHPTASCLAAPFDRSASRSQARSMRRTPSAISSSLTISGGRAAPRCRRRRR